MASAYFFDTKGEKIAGYIKDAIELKPMESTHLAIEVYDKKGGPRADFIVKWRSKEKVNQPIVEGVMLGTMSGQGIFFVCPGRVIIELY
ncbi:MAG: DUF3124 domain-containing protein [Deltaproteobacteria bacterium]|nr:DUF3124 domain-containing protein [Deltaproteobacteria bacterium]